MRKTLDKLRFARYIQSMIQGKSRKTQRKQIVVSTVAAEILAKAKADAEKKGTPTTIGSLASAAILDKYG